MMLLFEPAMSRPTMKCVQPAHKTKNHTEHSVETGTKREGCNCENIIIMEHVHCMQVCQRLQAGLCLARILKQHHL